MTTASRSRLVPRAGKPHAWRRLLAIEDRIFTRKRVGIYGIGVVAALAIILCRALGSWFHLIGSDGKIPGIDFCWIWFSGKFVAAGHATSIYDRPLYETAYKSYFHQGECHLLLKQYVYPPTFLFLTSLLGTMPYVIAFAVWIGATLALYLAAVSLILPGWPTIVLALTPFAVFFDILIGHNGFLTAGLVGLSLVFFERRPRLGGIVLGLLTYKPQFGVLFPPALLAAREWRALAGAAAAGLALAAAAGIAFGWATWPDFVASLFDRSAGLSPQAGAPLLFDSVYGLLYWAGAGPWLAGAVQLAVSAALAFTVWAIWARPIRYPLKAATLAVASLLATPYVLPYDLSVLSIAVAFLVKDGVREGFLAGERSLILIGFAVLYVPMIPLGAIVCAVLFLLVLRRIAATIVAAPVSGL